MIASLDKEKFLQLLDDLHSHTTYYPDGIAERLIECGIEATASADNLTLYIEGKAIPTVEPEWGEPGIMPQQVLAQIYYLTIGEYPQTNMTGKGFQYRDMKGKLEAKWGMQVCKDLL